MKRSYRILPVCFILFSAAFSLSGKKTILEEITIPIYKGKIGISQALGNSAMISGFITTAGAWNRSSPKVYMASIGGLLYVAYEHHFSEESPVRTLNKDSTAIFSGDCIEFFLSPQNNGKDYFHIVVDKNKNIYDAKCSVSDSEEKRNISWNSNAQVAIKKDLIEIQIPYSSLETLPPKEKDQWGVNFCINKILKNNTRNSSSFAGLTNFNSPKKFIRAIFTKKALSCAFQIKNINFHKGLYGFNFNFRNMSGLSRDAKIVISIDGKKYKKEYALKPGKNQYYFTLELPKCPNIPISVISIIDVNIFLDKKLIYSRSAFLNGKPILDLKLDRYYCENSVLSFSIDKSTNDESNINIEIVTPEGRRIRQKIENTEKKGKITLKALSSGRYIFSLIARFAGTVVQQDRIFIIPPSEINKVNLNLPENINLSVNANGRFLLNEKVFFPFLTSLTPQNSPLGKDTFNVRYNNKNLIKNPLLRARGPIYSRRTKNPNYRQFIISEIPIKKYVENTSSKRLFCRNILYEAGRSFVKKENETIKKINNLQYLRNMNRAIKTIAPECLTSIQIDHGKNYSEYQNIADILEVAFSTSSYADNLNLNLLRDIKNMRNHIHKSTPFLLWIGASIPPNKRSAEDIRCALYISMLNGASGVIFHMGHGGIPLKFTRLWSVFNGLAKEVKFVYPIICTSEKLDKIDITCENPQIYFVVRKYHKNIFVIAVNKSPSTVNAKFSVSGFDVAELPVENRIFEIKNKIFEDIFTGYEPHIYKLKSKRTAFAIR